MLVLMSPETRVLSGELQSWTLQEPQRVGIVPEKMSGRAWLADGHSSSAAVNTIKLRPSVPSMGNEECSNLTSPIVGCRIFFRPAA